MFTYLNKRSETFIKLVYFSIEKDHDKLFINVQKIDFQRLQILSSKKNNNIFVKFQLRQSRAAVYSHNK